MFFVVKKLFSWIKTYWPELLLLLFSIYSRLIGNNWDSDQHLHPDERFLTMVQMALAVPTSWTEYLNPQFSTFSPYNQGYGFYVYGTLPLILNKLIAVFAQTDTYGLTTLQGRALSGLADIATIIALYQLTKEFFAHKKTHQRKVALFVAASYAFAVLPIQLAHFFAVDSFLNFCLIMTLLQHVRYLHSPSWKRLLAGSVFFGLALACKINAVLIAPLIGIMVLVPFWQKIHKKTIFRTLIKLLTTGVLYLIVAYVVVRFTSPHYFAAGALYNPTPSQHFIDNLKSLKQFEGPDVWYPPAIQWLSKPKIWFSIKNIVLYGYGIGLSVLTLFGFAYIIDSLKQRTARQNLWPMYLFIGWGLVFLLYQSMQFVQAIRYFIIIYPVLALLSGLGWLQIELLFKNKPLRPILHAAIVVLLLIWPLAFLGIYHQTHSRIAASQWMHQSLPSFSLIGHEYWDDPLPIGVPGSKKQFMGESLHVFDQDSFDKWLILNAQLDQLDYYVLSSNRAWGSITAVPKKYPRMAAFYQDMFANKTDFELIATFTSYPTLRYLGIPVDFPTDGADESFTVYDHPKVMIFMNKNTKRLPEVVGYDSATTK